MDYRRILLCTYGYFRLLGLARSSIVFGALLTYRKLRIISLGLTQLGGEGGGGLGLYWGEGGLITGPKNVFKKQAT